MLGPMQRFDGLRRLYGDGWDRVARAHVLLVGLGGVGSWAAEALARSGVGALTLVDGDDVCVSNVNRQLHAVEGSIGKSKAEVMAERMRSIHPACRVTAIQSFFVRTEADQFFGEPYDYVVDAVDGVTAKAALIGNCHHRGIPVITCGAAAGKVQPGQVQVADLMEAHHDRLLMFVRKLLRKHHGFPKRGQKKFGVPCVFSPEAIRMPEGCAPDAPPAGDEAPFPDADARLNCEGRLGSAVFVTGAFGFHAAAHVVNALAGGHAAPGSRTPAPRISPERLRRNPSTSQ
jgi:tRNA A37 threonylcarbamoyladenosine dehydratase